MQNQIIDHAMKKKKAWSPRRFKKFPRFTIFLNRDDESKVLSKDNIINLSPDYMNFLLNNQSKSEDLNRLYHSGDDADKSR